MRKLLLPFSLIYAAITLLRNLLYDKGFLRQASFNAPVICVGNITVGGTGKTPCIEYIAGELSRDHIPGLVSRGYRRKTKGVVIAKPSSDAFEIGDEPFQISQRFPSMPIVVGEKRVEAIASLLSSSKADVVLMDDGFQHRAVKAGMYIMMMDFNRPIWRDFTFPAGNMREPASGRKRANIIIVSKCPEDISPETRAEYIRKLNPSENQHVFFTRIKYGALQPFANQPMHWNDGINIIAVSGIANTAPFIGHLKTMAAQVDELSFGDHHNFSNDDLLMIENKFAAMPHNSSVVTTQKDAARLKSMDLKDFTFISKLFILPIEMEFLFNDKTKFDQLINHYVAKNQ